MIRINVDWSPARPKTLFRLPSLNNLSIDLTADRDGFETLVKQIEPAIERGSVDILVEGRNSRLQLSIRLGLDELGTGMFGAAAWQDGIILVGDSSALGEIAAAAQSFADRLKAGQSFVGDHIHIELWTPGPNDRLGEMTLYADLLPEASAGAAPEP